MNRQYVIGDLRIITTQHDSPAVLCNGICCRGHPSEIIRGIKPFPLIWNRREVVQFARFTMSRLSFLFGFANFPSDLSTCTGTLKSSNSDVIHPMPDHKFMVEQTSLSSLQLKTMLNGSGTVQCIPKAARVLELD